MKLKIVFNFRHLACLILLAGCQGQPPEHPPFDSISWHTYQNEALGLQMEVPDLYSVREASDGHEVIFRMDGYPVLIINLLHRDQAAKQGLWAGHQAVGTGSLSGVLAQRFEYQHSDGPLFMHTISWVIPRGDQYLELGLRTNSAEPDPVQQHLLTSVRLDQVE